MKRLMMGPCVAGVLALMSTIVRADIQFLDQNFNSDTVGSAPAVGPPGPVITTPGSLGGYSTENEDGDSPPNSSTEGTILVQNSQKQAVFSSLPSNVETGALYMDTGFNVASEQMTLSFDIDVLTAPSIMTTTNSQPMTINGDPSDIAGILFGARIANSDNGQWAFSVAVVPTGPDGGVYALRNVDNSNLTTFGSYTNGQDNRVTVVADYAAGTANAYVNGVLGTSAYPLRGGIDNTATSNELFMYMNGENAGSGNSVAVDNIAGFDFANPPAATPEPATFAIWTAGIALAIGVHRRRQSR
ncbi:MAG TPA: hypothetical protein VGG64_19670 [Pirellulales bacterium]